MSKHMQSKSREGDTISGTNICYLGWEKEKSYYYTTLAKARKANKSRYYISLSKFEIEKKTNSKM